jgi:ribosomal protein S18 acetylase RimI-like enzyme
MPFLRHLYRTGREEELAALNWPDAMRRDFCLTQFEAQHRDYTGRYPMARFLVIEAKREPIGRLYIDFSGEAAHLIDIALLPASQGQGIGGRILVALQEQARATGQALRLSVARMNNRAACLYARHGFSREAEGATHLSMLWNPADRQGSLVRTDG